MKVIFGPFEGLTEQFRVLEDGTLQTYRNDDSVGWWEDSFGGWPALEAMAKALASAAKGSAE